MTDERAASLEKRNAEAWGKGNSIVIPRSDLHDLLATRKQLERVREAYQKAEGGECQVVIGFEKLDDSLEMFAALEALTAPAEEKAQ